jgi:hypothetical protein
LTRTLATPCLGREPKVRVATKKIMQKKEKIDAMVLDQDL